MDVHPALQSARFSAERYQVLPSTRGWYVWRFYDWTLSPGGWCILVETKSREDGWLHVLSRLGLMREPPPLALAPPVKITVTDAEWF